MSLLGRSEFGRYFLRILGVLSLTLALISCVKSSEIAQTTPPASPPAIGATGGAPLPGQITGNIPDEYRGMSDPFQPDDPQIIQTGSQLYQSNCIICHGPQGHGDGPDAPQLEPRPANYTTPEMLAAFQQHQDYVFWWVSEGVPQSGMPSFKNMLSPTERWQVITYEWHLSEQGNR